MLLSRVLARGPGKLEHGARSKGAAEVDIAEHLGAVRPVRAHRDAGERRAGRGRDELGELRFAGARDARQDDERLGANGGDIGGELPRLEDESRGGDVLHQALERGGARVACGLLGHGATLVVEVGGVRVEQRAQIGGERVGGG